MTAVTASAPGKVLITGGYLVLEPAFTGLVLTVSARFRTRVFSSPIPQWAESLVSQSNMAVYVHTPQVSATPSRYEYLPDTASLQQTHGSPNKFVELTLRLSLLVAHSLRPAAFQANANVFLELNADSQFYAPPSDSGKTGKTGLGSSAALTVSLTAALLAHFSLWMSQSNIIADNMLLELAHHLAQAAHCAAQGKVGSGFDVSAAFSGSQRYRRFDPAILAPLVELLQGSEWSIATIQQYLITPYTVGDADSIKWRLNHQTDRFHLPPGFDMLLGDVSGGSETPGMVKKVLQWRASATDSALWSQLGACNDMIDSLFRRLHSMASESSELYSQTISAFAKIPAEQWSSLVGVSLPSNTISEVLLSLQLTFCGQGSHSNSVRGLLRQVGDAAGVGIEPIEQTNLLDRVCQLPGVLFAGVPGAGGHDAIFCILLRSDDIGSVGQQMTLIDGGGRVKPLQVSRADEGVRCDFEQ